MVERRSAHVPGSPSRYMSHQTTPRAMCSIKLCHLCCPTPADWQRRDCDAPLWHIHVETGSIGGAERSRQKLTRASGSWQRVNRSSRVEFRRLILITHHMLSTLLSHCCLKASLSLSPPCHSFRMSVRTCEVSVKGLLTRSPDFPQPCIHPFVTTSSMKLRLLILSWQSVRASRTYTSRERLTYPPQGTHQLNTKPPPCFEFPSTRFDRHRDRRRVSRPDKTHFLPEHRNNTRNDRPVPLLSAKPSSFCLSPPEP